MKFILGSSSPNRKEVLDRLGIQYQVIKPTYEEHIIPTDDTTTQVRRFSEGKAHSITQALTPTQPTLVLGFDSMIEHQGRAIGKVHSKDEMESLIYSFVGSTQRVITGTTLAYHNGTPGAQWQHTTIDTATTVHFRSDITPQMLNHYAQFDDWQGKCGAYSILGPGIFFLSRIDGDFQNIIGIPLLSISHAFESLTGTPLLNVIRPTARPTGS